MLTITVTHSGPNSGVQNLKRSKEWRLHIPQASVEENRAPCWKPCFPWSAQNGHCDCKAQPTWFLGSDMNLSPYKGNDDSPYHIASRVANKAYKT